MDWPPLPGEIPIFLDVFTIKNTATFILCVGLITFNIPENYMLRSKDQRSNAKKYSKKCHVLLTFTFSFRYLEKFMVCTDPPFHVLSEWTTLAFVIINFMNAFKSLAQDTFPITLLILPCIGFVILHDIEYERLCFSELTWIFSYYLEVIALVPLMYKIAKNDWIDTPFDASISLMTIYKIVDVVYWHTKINNCTRTTNLNHIPFLTGVVQIVLQVTFLIKYYIKSGTCKSKKPATPLKENISIIGGDNKLVLEETKHVREDAV